jgi:aminoglycoside phosphotransferase (APT) family kinase protein
VRDKLSADLQRPADEFANALRAAVTSPRSLSYPDLQPDNVVWTNGSPKIVDLELLTATDCFGLDLIYTCHSYGLNELATDRYVDAYRRAGGNVTAIVDSWGRCESLWRLRTITVALEQDDCEQARAVLGGEGDDTDAATLVRKAIDHVTERL